MKRTVGALALLLVASCGEPSRSMGPEGPAELTLDAVVGGDLAVGASTTYRYRSAALIGVELGVTAVSGAVTLAVWDSASGARLAGARASSSAIGGPSAKTSPLLLAAGQAVRVTIAADSGAPASFRASIYRSSAAPESRAQRFALGDTVRESHAGTGDVDVFILDVATAGQEVLVAGQMLGPQPELTWTLKAESTGVLVGSGFISYHGYPASELERYISGPDTLRTAGRYLFTVTNPPHAYEPDSSRYEFQVRVLDRAPEGRSAAVVPGDVVDEAVRPMGDIDTYTLTAAPGTEVKTFFQSRGLEGWLALHLEGPGIVGGDAVVGPADTAAFLRYVPRQRLPSSGPYQLRVAGAAGEGGIPRGSYRFRVYPVRRSPEVATAALADGDTSAEETFDTPGDIDEFPFTLAAQAYVHASLLGGGDGSSPVFLDIVRDAGDSVVSSASRGQHPDDRLGTPTLLLPAGAYRLRVTDGDLAYGHAYRVTWKTVDPGPEAGGAAVTVGDTVTGTITTGDIDRFTFSGDSGQRFTVAFGVAPGSGAGELGLYVAPLSDPGTWLGAVNGPASGTVPDTLQTYRFTLPATGSYVIGVVPLSGGTEVAETGTYHFTLRSYPSLPEHTPQRIAAGDSIDTESLDEFGDVDSLLVTGTPLREIELFALFWYGEPPPAVALASDSVRHPGPGGSLGRMTLPASGEIPLMVQDTWEAVAAWGFQRFWHYGAYTAWSYYIDRAPEGRSPAVALGDSVTSRIEVVGDVDEYTVALTAGDSVVLAAGQGWIDSAWLSLLAPDGAEVTSLHTSNCFGCDPPWAESRFVAPATGTFTVRVSGYTDREGTPEYWFKLSRP
jgi:hypothetical protein